MLGRIVPWLETLPEGAQAALQSVYSCTELLPAVDIHDGCVKLSCPCGALVTAWQESDVGKHWTTERHQAHLRGALPA